MSFRILASFLSEPFEFLFQIREDMLFFDELDIFSIIYPSFNNDQYNKNDKNNKNDQYNKNENNIPELSNFSNTFYHSSILIKQSKFILQIEKISNKYHRFVENNDKLFKKYIKANPWGISDWKRLHHEKDICHLPLDPLTKLPIRNEWKLGMHENFQSSTEIQSMNGMSSMRTTRKIQLAKKSIFVLRDDILSFSMQENEIEKLEWIEAYIRKMNIKYPLAFDSNLKDIFYFQEKYFLNERYRFEHKQKEIYETIISFESSFKFVCSSNKESSIKNEEKLDRNLDENIKKHVDNLYYLKQIVLVSLFYWIYLCEIPTSSLEEKNYFLERAFHFTYYYCKYSQFPFHIDELYHNITKFQDSSCNRLRSSSFISLFWFHIEREMYFWFHYIIRCTKPLLPNHSFQNIYEIINTYTFKKISIEFPFYFHGGLTLIYYYSYLQSLSSSKINITNATINEINNSNTQNIHNLHSLSENNPNDIDKINNQSYQLIMNSNEYISNNFNFTHMDDVQKTKNQSFYEIFACLTEAINFYQFNFTDFQKNLFSLPIYKLLNTILPILSELDITNSKDELFNFSDIEKNTLNNQDTINALSLLSKKILQRNFFISLRNIPSPPTIPIPPHLSNVEDYNLSRSFFPESPSNIPWINFINYKQLVCSPHSIRIQDKSLNLFQEVALLCKYNNNKKKYNKKKRKRELFLLFSRFYSKKSPTEYYFHNIERNFLMFIIATQYSENEINEIITTSSVKNEWISFKNLLNKILNTNKTEENEIIEIKEKNISQSKNNIYTSIKNKLLFSIETFYFSQKERKNFYQILIFVQQCLKDLIYFHTKIDQNTIHQLEFILLQINYLIQTLKKNSHIHTLNIQLIKKLTNQIQNLHKYCIDIRIFSKDSEQKKHHFPHDLNETNHSNYYMECVYACYNFTRQFIHLLIRYTFCMPPPDSFSPSAKAVLKVHHQIEKYILN